MEGGIEGRAVNWKTVGRQGSWQGIMREGSTQVGTRMEGCREVGWREGVRIEEREVERKRGREAER